MPLPAGFQFLPRRSVDLLLGGPSDCAGMKLPSPLCLLLLLSLALGAAEKPNFIFLFSDDQQADTIGAWGNPLIETPNLDRMVGEGFSFRSAYCGGSFSGAVCVASRSMLMTGRHWHQIDDKKNWKRFTTLPEKLTKAGYHSHIVGKWHNGEKTLLRSFQSGSSVFIGGMTNHLDVPLAEIEGGKLENKRMAKGFSTTMFTDAAVEFLSKEQKDPFFLYVAYTAPHDTRNPPQKYRDMYYKKKLPLPANFMPLHPFDNGRIDQRFRDESLAPWPRPEGMIRDQIAEYYGLVTQLDEQLGRVLKALEDSPHADNTYVIFTSDHGLALGRHGLMGKQSLYEHSMHTPLIITGPNVPKKQASDALVYLHDLHPTLLKLAGAQTEDIDGVADLAPIWRGEKKTVRDSLFMGFQKYMRSVRDERWKLILYPQINHRQLFDLANDPDELTNLAEDPKRKATVARLTGLMKEWQQELSDGQPHFVENPASMQYDHTKFRQTLDRWQPDWIVDKYFPNE